MRDACDAEMLSDTSASYPSSPTRTKSVLDAPDTHEVMLLPPGPSDALHGYRRASATTAALAASELGDDGSTQEPARGMVEPWSSLLLGDQDQEEESVQVGREQHGVVGVRHHLSSCHILKIACVW